MGIEKNTLVLDIETDGKDAQTAIFKFVGAYSYLHDKEYFLSSLEDLQNLVNEHKYIVTFNGKKFDIPILERNGVKFDFKIQIDLANMIQPKPFYGGKARCKIIKTKKGLMSDNIIGYSLDAITKFLELNEEKILNFNYDILKKDFWTKEELKEIETYTIQDIIVTKKLYEWLEYYFARFDFLLTSEQIRKKHYLTTSPGSYAYKVLCNKAGLEEKYGYGTNHYQGGFVAVPRIESASGKIICFDFKSAYPHAFFMCNLYSLSNKPGFKGCELFELSGNYNNEELGKIEQAIKELFLMRAELKEKEDPAEYAIKIVINTIYGISGSPVFQSIYNSFTAPDCTLIVRTWVKYARKMFRKAGFIVLYTATDSVYVLIPSNRTLAQLMKVKEEIVSKIKANVPFPSETFDMGVEASIKYIQFFKDKEGILKKNFYLYLTEEGKIVVKGLAIIKSNSSKLSKIIYARIKDEIRKNGNCKFSFETIQSMLHQELNKDISIASILYRVKHHESYKKASQLQAQISKVHGSGNHYMLKNSKVGVGKSLKYCTLEEANDAGLKPSDLNLNQVWNELEPFIEDFHTRNVKEGKVNACLKDYIKEEVACT